MSLEFFAILLWIPFGLLFLCFAIPYCATGFKKGFLRALVSTGATAVAAVVSFFAAKLLASIGVPYVMELIPPIEAGEGSAISAVLPVIIEGVVTGLLSVAIFSLLLFILTLVCKLLFALIPVPKGKGLISRLLGMGLRLVDAVVLTVLLLLPIYGTIAAYGPSAVMVMEFSESSTEAPQSTPAAEDYLRSAVEHPTVAISKAAPFDALYRALSASNTDMGQLNVPQTLQTLTKTADSLQSILNGDITAEDLDILDDIKNDLVNTDLFYGMVSAYAQELKASLSEAGEDAAPYAQALDSFLTLPKEAFREACSGILDWISYAAEQDLFQVMEEGTMDAQWITESGILQKTMEIQSVMPEEFPFFELVAQFFSQYTATPEENTP